jgi:alkyl hydroperoxide reductase subunit AhpF
MMSRTLCLFLVLPLACALFSCADSNPSAAFSGDQDYLGVWRYQSAGEIASKDGGGLHFTPCSGLDGQMKLRNDGTWSEWRSIDARFYPSAGNYTVAEGVITFHHSDGRLFETKKYTVSGSGVGATMTVVIDSPGFVAHCTLVREE